MPVTQVGICNSALIKVGGSVIQSLTQDTKSAQILNAIYAHIRNEVLRAHKWKFAMKRAILSPLATTPEFEYNYQYTVPLDCLRVVSVDDDKYAWTREGEYILSDNEAGLEVLYIYRNEDESSWDSSFSETFAWRLAGEIAYAMTQSTERTKTCMEGYKESLAYARSFSSTEGTMKDFQVDVWTDSRK